MTDRELACGIGQTFCKRLRIGVSALSLAGIALMMTAGAQEDDTDESDDPDRFVIVVTGIRGSLQSAQDIKRNADTFVDAITAEDIGALPDRSVAEALQRLPGVAINRFEGTNDPDHFSVEGAGAVIRGLTLTRSELNGRDVFSADNGQGIGFNDVAPELLGSVQVFKNQSADLIEGGISGTVNLNVRKPFDQAGSLKAFTIEASYSDLAEKTTPSFSGVYTNRWDTKMGEFGVLIGGSYSELKSRADSTLVTEFLDRDADDGQQRLVPSGAGIRTILFDRERNSIAASAQWRSADQSIEATASFFRASYDNAWTERAVEPSIDDAPTITPHPGTAFVFSSHGLLRSGVISQNVGWRGGDPSFPLNGVRQLALSRGRQDKSLTTDHGLMVKWMPTDRFRVDFDVQYAQSKVDITDFTVHSAFYADVDLDLGGGGVPDVTYVTPDGQSAPYYSDLSNYYLRSAMDHLTDNTGDEIAVRLDAEYDFSGESWVKSVRFGVRTSERDQIIRSSTFNWGNISEQWNGGGVRLNDETVIPVDTFRLSRLDNYMRGRVADPGLGGGVPFYTGPLATDYAGAAELLSRITTAAGNRGWTPLAQRDGVVAGMPFLPSEISDLVQKTRAVYVRFDFGADDIGYGVAVSGNIGVRHVKTEMLSNGASSFPDGTAVLAGRTVAVYCATPVQGAAQGPVPCRNGLDLAENYFRWADGSSSARTFRHDYENWLPSLNVKFGLRDDHIVRLGYSQAIHRPDFGLARASFSIVEGDTDSATGAWLGPRVSTGNIFLDPVVADQYDISYEWYFSRVGVLTATLFHKKVRDYITPLATTVSLQNNGVAFDVNLDSNGNFSRAGTVQGLELAWQQVFDMLPAPYNGLGMQANYTWTESDGVPSIAPKNDEPGGVAPPPVVDISRYPLPLLSENNVNLVAFYEDERFSARLAYSWRDEHVLTSRDVIFPYTPILHAPTGQLDGSFFYNITDNLKMGIQVVNLLDETVETKAVIDPLQDGNLVETPRNFSITDRRFAVSIRGRF